MALQRPANLPQQRTVPSAAMAAAPEPTYQEPVHQGSFVAEDEPFEQPAPPVFNAPAPAQAYNAQVPAPAAPAGGLVEFELPDFTDVDLSDLTLGYGAFPIIKLDKGEFVDSDGQSFGKSFQCVLIPAKDSRKVQHIYRALTPTPKGPKCMNNKTDLIFSYDGVNTTKGGLVQDWTLEKQAEGKTIEVSQNVMALATLVGPGITDTIRMLQIPAASITRLNGHIATLRLFRKEGKAVTTCSVGPAIAGADPSSTFTPWVFK